MEAVSRKLFGIFGSGTVFMSAVVVEDAHAVGIKGIIIAEHLLGYVGVAVFHKKGNVFVGKPAKLGFESFARGISHHKEGASTLVAGDVYGEVALVENLSVNVQRRDPHTVRLHKRAVSDHNVMILRPARNSEVFFIFNRIGLGENC